MADTPVIPEKFDIGKFFSGFTSAVSWAKDAKTMITIGIVVFVGFTLYRAYIMPRTVQKQQPKITVQSGGQGTFNFVQEANKERRWFIGPTVSVSKKKDYFVGITILRSF